MTSKNSSNLESVEFTLALLDRIPSNRKITANELYEQLKAAGFERSKRTIERHLTDLSEKFGIDRDDRSRPFGYRRRKGHRNTLIRSLSDHEALLLTLAEQQLKNLLPATLMKSMDSFFEQAHHELSQTEHSSQGHAWLTKVRVIRESQPLIAPPVNSEVLEIVSNALFEDRWLNLEYKNASGQVSKIEVMPLGLAQQGPRLYLVCRYKGFDNERTLAVHRIKSAKSSFTFERPKDFDLEHYDTEGRFGFGEGKKIRLTFKVTKSRGGYLLEYRLSEDQTEQDLGDYYEISATVIESAQLDWWLNSFGDKVKDIQKVVV